MAFPRQQQTPPRIQADMHPIPACGEESYRGSGRLTGKRAVITGGTSTPASAATVVTGGAAGAAARIASVEEVPAGPHGKGSAKAGADGSGPAGWLIKGNADSMLFHGPDSPAYEQTIAEVWFFDEDTARKAGFDKWDKNFR